MHEYRNRYGSVSGGSALSKSMKYAETWLYGTVSARPVSARPSAFGLHRGGGHHDHHQGAPQAVIAVVMCSCPEFLAGTTRSKKAASTCKKCGGTRRPLPTTVGTVRGYGTVSQPARVRPSLLQLTENPMLRSQDPYDLMRRSRMSVDNGQPAPAHTKTHHHKARAKSSSPPRRRRVRSPSPPKQAKPPAPPPVVLHPRLQPASRDVGDWAVDEDDDDPRGMRKSILECDVNPYDLISKYLKNGHNGTARVPRALCSDGGESSDNLSDNALEDLPRPEMVTFGKGSQPAPAPPQQQTPPAKGAPASPSKKALFQKEDLARLGAKFNNLKQTLSPDSKTKPAAAANKKTEFKLGNGTAKPGKPVTPEAGVTISGQRIRIFNGVPGAVPSGAPDADGDYVSDDALDDNLAQFEPKAEDVGGGDATTATSSSEEETPPTVVAPESPRIPRVASPKRPPRRSKQLVSQEAPEAASPSALQLRRQRSQSLVSPVTVPEIAIKSILKKSAGGDQLSGGESVASSSPRTSPAPSSAEGSISSGTSQFYLPTFKEFKEQQKKKKQVQFRVSDDAAGSGPASPGAVCAEPAVTPEAAGPPAEHERLRDEPAPPEPERVADVSRVSSPEMTTSTDDELTRETDSGGDSSGSGSAAGSGRPRASNLRRSHSERLAAPPRRCPRDGGARGGGGGGAGAARPQQPGDMFNDTMRLRLRAARPSSRAVFSDDSSGAEDGLSPRRAAANRPREPPPPPPPLPAPATAPEPAPAPAPLGERPAPIGRTSSNAKAFEEQARSKGRVGAGPQPAEVHRLEIKNVLFDEPPSLDIDALAQRTTSIFIDGGGSGGGCGGGAVTVEPAASPPPATAGNKVTISVGGASPAGDIDYQAVSFARTCPPPTAAPPPAPAAPVQPVVIPVAHQNHCSRVEIGDQSDEKRTSTKMTVRIGPTSDAPNVVLRSTPPSPGTPVTSTTPSTPVTPVTPSTPVSLVPPVTPATPTRTAPAPPEPVSETRATPGRKRVEPNETINLLIAESVDPVDAVRRNLVPHVCGGTTPTASATSSRSSSFDESDVPAEAGGAAHNKQALQRKSSASSTASRGKSGADIMREVLSLRHDAEQRAAEEQRQGAGQGAGQGREEGRSKFYVWVDAEQAGLGLKDDFNHYEMIRDPIYEEITDHDEDEHEDAPPPLPLSPPPLEDKMACCRSIFEGASKDDILSYLVDARDRGIVPSSAEEVYFGGDSSTGLCEEGDDSEGSQPQHSRQTSLDLTELSSRVSQLSNTSDSSEDSVNLMAVDAHDDSKVRRAAADIERNDSGVGSETSRTSRARWQQLPADQRDQRHGCEDCEMPVETQVTDSGLMFAPLVCRKCAKRRLERREIIQEIVETEEKFAGDLRILLDEFYKPMLVAGLLAREQLSAIFLNAEELQAHATALAERLRDSLEMAVEQGDDDLLSVDIGRLFLAATPMLRAFEHYCTRQAAASLLLASLEKEKELLRIFLRVSQMENAVLRRMNLNSFLMVPVQRVTKYPLLLARLYKVTPCSHPAKELLLQAQHHIELHLEHMNSVAKDISSTKLWRRITITNGRRAGSESDMVNIKLRKMAVEVLEWTQDVSFPMEGRLLFAQPADSSWRRGRAVKMSPVSALLVTQGHPSSDTPMDAPLHFASQAGVRAATLLLLREKGGRYSLLRDPLFLDKCMVCCEVDWDDYFEVQELATKDSFVFKAEDAERTRTWYRQLQVHAQGLGSWRKRRNALANIMINGMQLRS